MGFDLHGMNPVIREGKEPKRPDNLWELSEKKREKYPHYHHGHLRLVNFVCFEQ